MKAKFIIGCLSALNLLSPAGFASEVVQPETFSCSLQVIENLGDRERVRVQIEDQPVQIDTIQTADHREGPLTELFEGVIEEIRQGEYLPYHFMAKRFFSEEAGSQPQLSVGVYYYNRFEATQRSVMAAAVGHEQAGVKLNVKLSSSNNRYARLNCVKRGT